ncbi:MAG: DUF2341 domain-containing protein [Candidatus Paceibacterota bacterium]
MHRKFKVCPVKRMQFNRAFTLIELLVVIVIVGILAGFIFVSMSSAINSAKDTKIKADMATVQKAVMEYAALNSGAYPATLSVLVPTYLGAVPLDPNGSSYTYTNAGTSFTLAGTLSTGLPWVYDSSNNTWGGGYTYGRYKKVINIKSNPNGTAITGIYPVKLIVDTATLVAATNMRSDCNDLRFSDNPVTANLSYWIESGCNTSATIIWVELPNGVASGGTDINMYYGTQTVSGSDGDGTFSFFDHFDAALDTTTKWTLVSGSFAVASSILSNSAGTTNSQLTMNYPNISSGTWAFRTRMSMAQSSAQSAWIGTAYNGMLTMSRLSASNYGYSSYNCSWGGPSRGDFGTGYTGYHIVEGLKKTASFATIIDGTQVVDNNGNICLTVTNWMFSGGAGYGNNAISIDWILARPYNSAEPTSATILIGGQETGQ